MGPQRSAKTLSARRKAAIFDDEVQPNAVATAAALVTEARDASLPELAGVLGLLADLLVCGNADLWVKIGYEVRTPAFEAAEPDQIGRALYETIAAGADAYVAHLRHPDAAVRAALAPLLAYLSRETERIAPALLAHVPEESDAVAQGALAIALGHQARYHGVRCSQAAIAGLQAIGASSASPAACSRISR